MTGKMCSMCFVGLMIATAFASVIIAVPEGARAHVADNSGDPLQLYSYFTPKAPKINGDITDSTTNAGVTPTSGSDPAEWDGAYVRKSSIRSSTDGTERLVYILLMNDDQYLYVAILIDQTNSGTGKWVQLYFDEGSGTSSYDGSHDDLLTPNNEDTAISTHNNNNVNDLTDGFWNGASWANEAAAHFSSQSWKAGQYFTYEFAIPLNNINTDSATGSDLDVLSTDEIGFNFKFFETTGSTAIMDWTLTSNNYNSASGWADVKLGLEKSERDLYATYTTMNPTIDGDISNDFAWADTFIKKLKFTDFKGNTTDGTIFLSEAPSSSRINFGLSILHSTYNTGDYLRIYQERKAGGGPRDVKLDDNEENMIQVNGDGTFYDRYYIKNLNQPTWTNNDTDGDASALGDARFYNFAGTENDRYEFEACFYYNKGLYDCQFNTGAEIGFLIEFYDADTSSSYWWEATANVNAVQYQNDGTSVALGWATMQTGSPWLRLITPADGGSVEGNTFTIQVQADDPDGVNFVGYKVVGDLAFSSLTKVDALTYQGTWDTTTRANGIYDMIFVAQDNNNTIVKKKITVTIANPISSAPPSGVSITSLPITSGTGTVQATATAAARVEMLVDNVYVSDMVWNPATNRYETLLNTLNYNDGTHQVRARAINPVGEASAYQYITLDNWDDLTDTSIIQPSAGESINHTFNILSDFHGRNKAWAMYNSSVTYPGFCEIYVDDMLTAVQYEESEIIPAEEFGYNLTINTVWFDDGQHRLKSVVYGPEGTSLFDIILFNIVNKPTLQILSPAGGEVISGSAYELSIMAEDPNGDAIASAQFRIDGGPWFPMANIATPLASVYNATLDTTEISDGYHTIQFQVTDSSSAVSLSNVSVEVDNIVLSSVVITSPSIGETISNFYPVKAHPEPASQCKFAELYVDEIYCGFDNTLDVNGDYEFNLSTIGYSDGLHSIKVITYDPYGNLVVDTKTITFANIPIVILSSPTDGSVLSGTYHFELSASDSDGISVAQFRIDAGSWVNMTISGGPVAYIASYDVDTMTIPNGTHTLDFRVVDGGGFPDIECFMSVTVTVDNVDPSLCAIASPLFNEYISGLYVFQIQASDNLEVSIVELTLTGIGVFYPGYNPATGFYETARNTLPYADGTYTASAIVYDTAGNSKQSMMVSFYIDNNAPILNVSYPPDGKMVSGSVTIYTNGTSDAFLKCIEYNVDGTGWRMTSQEWDTTEVLDGLHTITIKATDNSSHVTTATIRVIVDNHAPLCAIVSPVNYQFIEGTFTFKVIASDDVEVKSVELEMFGMNYSANFNSVTNFYEYTINTLMYSEGVDWTVNATVTDASDKTYTYGPVTFRIDNSVPSLILNAPHHGQYVRDDVMFNLTVTDTYLISAEYSIEGSGWTDISAPWDTHNVADGAHTIYLRARDAAGHTTSQTIMVVVDNHDPVCTVSAPVNNQFIEGVYTFKIIATDEVGVLNVKLDIFNATVYATHNTQTGFYEYMIDTHTLPEDAAHTLYVNATDLSGRWTVVGPILFHIDNNAPTLNLYYPKHASYVSGTVNFDVQANDTFLTAVQYSIDGNDWVNITVPWDTSSFADGRHDIVIRAKDAAGHTTTQSIYTVIDNHAPTCAIASPVRNQFVEGILTVRVMAEDQVGISNVTLELFGMTVFATFNSQSGYYEFSVDTTAWLEDIQRTVRATACDLSGKSTSANVSFNVDNHAPIMTINSPANGAYVNGTVPINVTVIDVFPTPTEYNVDGTGWVGVVHSLDTTALYDGRHTLQIRARDLAGHLTEQAITIIVDNHAPRVSISSPDGGEFLEGLALFKVIAVDEVLVENVTLEMFGENISCSYNTQSGYYEVIADTTLRDDGDYFVNATVFDGSGKNTTSETILFHIDNNAPALEIISPRNGDYLSGLVEINVTMVDVFSRGTEYSIDGGAWFPTNIMLDTTRLVDGAHLLTVRASDKAGHTTLQTIEITTDNIAPKVLVLSPRQSSTVGGTIMVKADVRDAVMVTSVRIGIDESDVEFMDDMLLGQGRFYEYEIDTKKFADGSHVITLRAEDICGHNTTHAINVVVDNTGPSITINFPDKDRKTVTGKVVFDIQPSDPSNVSSVYISIDTGVWTEMMYDPATNSYTYIWYTSIKDNGLHRVDFKAVDKLGSESVARRDVRVENTKEPDYLGGLMSVLPLIAFLFIVCLIVAVFLLMRYGVLQKWAKGEAGFEKKEKRAGMLWGKKKVEEKKPNEKLEEKKPLENLDDKNPEEPKTDAPKPEVVEQTVVPPGDQPPEPSIPTQITTDSKAEPEQAEPKKAQAVQNTQNGLGQKALSDNTSEGDISASDHTDSDEKTMLETMLKKN